MATEEGTRITDIQQRANMRVQTVYVPELADHFVEISRVMGDRFVTLTRLDKSEFAALRAMLNETEIPV